jgi:hypothetical protein
MTRITITLRQIEREALRTLADREFREPRAQAAQIIRAELERLGLLVREPLPANGAPIADAREEGMTHAKSN